MKLTNRRIKKIEDFGKNNGVCVLIEDIGDFGAINFVFDLFGCMDNMWSKKFYMGNKSFKTLLKDVENELIIFRNRNKHQMTFVAIGFDFRRSFTTLSSICSDKK